MISIDQRCHGKNRSLLQPKCLSPIQYWHWPNLISWDALMWRVGCKFARKHVSCSMMNFMCSLKTNWKTHQKFMQNRKTQVKLLELTHETHQHFLENNKKWVVFHGVSHQFYHRFPPPKKKPSPWEVGDPGTSTVSEGNGTSVASRSAACWGLS